eukprot:15329753-Ditylum_brightwellii.AAC.1
MLVVRGGTNIHSKYGVMQDDPFAMVLYALGVLSVIEHLQKYCKCNDNNFGLLFMLQIWYADDSAYASSAISFFKKEELKVQKDFCYLGGYLGNGKGEQVSRQ